MAQPQPQHSLTGAEAPGGHGGTFPPFQSETFVSQLLWLAITFGLLYWVMSRVALPRVAGVLEKRSARLASDLNEAQRLKAEAEDAAAAHEKSLAEARARAQAIAQETRGAVAADAAEKRKAIEAELADRLARSEAEIRARSAQAMSNVRDIAAETTAAIVERLTGRAPDRAAVEAALDRPAGRP